jgi:heterodisulfide reductase subunit A
LEAGPVCVVGAGIAGITVANNLARAGVRVSLVEKNPYPGGQSVFYGCKAAESCVQCGVCLVRDAVKQLRSNALTSCHFSASPTSLQRTRDGGFLIDLELTPNRIDPRSCTECGDCCDACRYDAIRQAPGWKYYVTEDCIACGDCVNRCAVGAIHLARNPERIQIAAQGIVVASGFHPFDPAVNRKWGYGTSPRVTTGSEMEKMFFEEKYVPDGCHRIAFIQCVGSRDVREGEPHCSRACCATSLRMANRIASEAPGTHIDVYYMDIQHFGRNFEDFLAIVRGKANFVRANPLCVRTDATGRPVVRFESLSDLRCQESAYDLVVLSNGMCPSESAAELADIFGLDLNAQGYLQCTEPANGIFVVGSCRQPMRIEESVEDASTVSHKVLRHLAVGI